MSSNQKIDPNNSYSNSPSNINNNSADIEKFPSSNDSNKFISTNTTQKNHQQSLLLNTTPEPEENVLNLFELFTLATKYWRSIVACVVISLTCGVLYLQFATKLYQARTLIRIDKYSPLLDGKRENSIQEETKEKDYISTKLRELKSLPLANRVLKQPSILELYQLHYSVSKNEVGSRYEFSPQVLQSYLNLISPNAIKDTSLISIESLTKNPELSALLVDTHAAQFIEFVRSQRLAADKELRELLSQQEKKLSVDLNEAEDTLANFAKKNKIIDLGAEENPASNRFKIAQKMLQDASAATLKAESDFLRAKSAIEKGATIVDDQAIQQLRNKLQNAEAKRKKLLETYASGYHEVRELSQEIESYRVQLSQQRQDSLKTLQVKYTSAKEYEDGLRNRLEEESESARSMTKSLSEYSRMKNDYESLKDVYEDVLKKIREVDIRSRSGGTVNISIVEPASIPKGQASPRPFQVLLFSLVTGLGAGLIITYLRFTLDRTVRDPDDLESVTQLPGLAVIPDINDAVTAYAKQEPLPALSTGFMVIDTPFTTAGEALKYLRAAVRLSSIDNPIKVVLITSSVSAEGKSMVAANLAASLAEDGFNTLVIDADLRKPSQNAYFRVPREQAGLTEILTNQIIYKDTLIKSEVDRLTLIPAGGLAPNPAELVGSKKFGEFVDHMRKEYDYVIIDSPPVLAVADSLLISQLCDGVIFIARCGLSQKRYIKKAVAKLQKSGAKVLGAVFNGVKNDKTLFSYAAGYYGYYTNKRKNESTQNAA
jgi:polysaccharide biosynthesis transport protein